MSVLKESELKKEILVNVKNDERFFAEFINFLERNKTKREIFLFALKRILIEESMKIFS